MNFSLYTCLKYYRITVGEMLLAIAITACNVSAKSQPSPAKIPSIVSSPHVVHTPVALKAEASVANQAQVVH